MSKPTVELSSDASDRSKQRPCSDEFRRDVVRLITDEGYSIPAAADACGVSDQTVRNWYGRFAPTSEPAGNDATVEELRAEVKRLRKQLKQAELERAILEKATARRRRFDAPSGPSRKGLCEVHRPVFRPPGATFSNRRLQISLR